MHMNGLIFPIFFKDMLPDWVIMYSYMTFLRQSDKSLVTSEQR